MKSRSHLLICGAAFIIILVVSIILTISYWEQVERNFFSFSIMDIVRVLVMIFIAGYISLFVSISSSKKSKEYDLLLDMLKDLQNMVTDVYEIGVDYMESPDQNNVRKINGKLKRVSGRITFVSSQFSKIYNKTNSFSPIESHYFAMKDALTGNHFASQSVEIRYSPEEMSKFISEYEKLTASITDVCLSLLR